MYHVLLKCEDVADALLVRTQLGDLDLERADVGITLSQLRLEGLDGRRGRR